MKSFLLLGCCLGLSQLAQAQSQVSGKVLDKQTHQPVPDHFTCTYATTLGRLLKADMRVQAVSFTYFYDWQPSANGLTYAGANMKESDIATIKQTTYDPTFWRDNPVVKRTPLEEEVIKSFEQQKAFGTMLTE